MKPRWRGLRTKIILWSFVPTALILAAVALVNFFAYQRVTRDLIIQRNRDQAALAADQFATVVKGYGEQLAALARLPAVYQGNAADQQATLQRERNRLAMFDAGTHILDSTGRVVAADPAPPGPLGQDWSGHPFYRDLLRQWVFRSPGGPMVSDILQDDDGGVIVIGAPIIGAHWEFKGVVSGALHLRADLLSGLYPNLGQLSAGRRGNTFLVDGAGKVIYHSDPRYVGQDFSAQDPVSLVLSGRKDAIASRNVSGRQIVASFAPVPGTGWGLVIEEDLGQLANAGAGFRWPLLALLALGLLVPALVVSVGLRRITRPIHELIHASQAVAQGHFDQRMEVHTGDELEQLAGQFNTMASDLQASYAILERKVAERTGELEARNRELALLNRVIAAATSELEPETVLEAVCRELGLTFGVPQTAAALLDDARTTLTVVAEYRQPGRPSAMGARIPLQDNPASQFVLQQKAPLFVADAQHDPRLAPVHALMRERGVASILLLPLNIRDQIVGTIGMDAIERREFTHDEIALAASAAAAAAQALENAWAKEALSASEERLKLAMEGGDVGVWDLDLDTDQTVIMQEWTDGLGSGYRPGETPSNLREWIRLVHPDDQPVVTAAWQRYLSGAAPLFEAEHRIRTKTGDWAWILLRGKIVARDARGRARRVTGIHQNITARKQAEEALRHAKEAAEAANRAKSAFLANMSHELRTPLNAILGFAQLLGHDPGLGDAQRQNLEIILRSGEHLLGLINDVLEMSKIEAGRAVLQPESFDLHRMLEGLEEMFHLRAADKRLVLAVERSDNLPQYVRADAGKLRQILMNLLGNAIKFTQEGGVMLRARCVGGSDRSARLQFSVEDTGPGIPLEEQEAIFAPFVQATSTQAQGSNEGTGLGLTISRQFAQMMGGEVHLESALGDGSTFTVELPVALASAQEIKQVAPARRATGLEPGQPVYRLLVVEDQETNRRLLVQLLARLAGAPPQGLELREAANGQEAVHIWEEWQPHLIWMDLRMPVMDGYEATRRIKATEQGRETVIIALTASAFENDRALILSRGCDDFVRKPFREEEIVAMLEQHLHLQFVFEQEDQIPEPALQNTLTVANLALVPPGWVARLSQAATELDSEAVLQVAAALRASDAGLAERLAALVHDFRFDIIQAAAQATEEAHAGREN